MVISKAQMLGVVSLLGREWVRKLQALWEHGWAPKSGVARAREMVEVSGAPRAPVSAFVTASGWGQETALW